ncbi:adenylosuccinate synthase [Candidatus Woesearchaeota archaeon]|nr:adenylosuccinate synthase [Candidatus Woesearchaeota archaeon]
MFNQVIAIVGGQWGDEGKGKVVDWAGSFVDVSARATGGSNAGHTIYIGNEKHVFHLIPSAITWENVDCILGNGMVIDPFVLQKEMDILQKKGYSLKNLNISGRAHIILIYHLFMDEFQENSKMDKKIGTTKTGIGPSYSDKFNRIGIRVNDLLHKDLLSDKIYLNLTEKLKLFRTFFSDDEILDRIKKVLLSNLTSKKLIDKVKGLNVLDLKLISELFTDIYFNFGLKLKPYIIDASDKIHCDLSNGKRLLIEGAQGLLLDIDHGTYPFVTSSNPSVGGLYTGLGISKIDETFSVIKAYVTRVGAGPFPTELNDEIGVYIREKASEYGSTTGRPRRCGWQDALILRFTSKINGPKIIVTRLDILSGIKTLKICNTYKYIGFKKYFNGEVYFNGKILKDFPADAEILQYCIPHDFIEVNGWTEDISNLRDYNSLPSAAKEYLKCLENYGNVNIAAIGIGPKREQMIVLEGWNLDKNKYKAIIYDLDNTLVATNDYVFSLLKTTASQIKQNIEFEIPSDDLIKQVLKKNLPFEEIFVQLFPNPISYTESEPLSKIILSKYRLLAQNIPYLSIENGPSIYNLFNKRNILQGITTNRVAMAEERLSQAGYGQFDFIIAPKKPENKKPNPQIIYDALEIITSKGIEKSKVLSVGDHTDDYLAAKSAGLDFVAILTGFTTKEDFISLGLEEKKIIYNLNQLNEIMEK